MITRKRGFVPDKETGKMKWSEDYKLVKKQSNNDRYSTALIVFREYCDIYPIGGTSYSFIKFCKSKIKDI